MTRTFESDVKVGELRILADVSRPVVVLIAEDRGAFGFRLIPVSDYTAINCEGEQPVGNRIYQHWNACNVPRSYVLRSWLVDTLPPLEFNQIHSQPSTSTSNLSPYQRAHLFSVPYPLDIPEQEIAHNNFSLFTFHFSLRKAAGFALAACVVFALVFAIHLDLDRASHKEEKAHAWMLAMKPPEPEPLEAEAEVQNAVCDEVVCAAAAPEFKLDAPKCAPLEKEPEIRARLESMRMMKAERPAKPSAPPAAERSVESRLDRVDVATMNALPRKTTADHAIAVMTYLACGVKANEVAFGGKLVESSEKLVDYVKTDTMAEEYTRRLVATALCRASVATKNPDLKIHAETALNGLGDKRAVEIVARGYDLIESWFESQRVYKPTSTGSVAQPIPYPAWFKFLKTK